MRNELWIPKATNTRSEYVTLIACPLQQWLHEFATMLRYSYSACHVNCYFSRMLEFYNLLLTRWTVTMFTSLNAGTT